MILKAFSSQMYETDLDKTYLNARVKVPFLIGLLKPPVASVMAIQVTNVSRLEVLGGHSIV